MISKEKICILIPAYNAQNTIGPVLEKVCSLGLDTLVVNDGSTDGTSAVVQSYGVKLLEHSKNLGKGASLRTGFQYILEKNYELVITLDADGQHDPLEIPLLLKAFDRVEPDLLIGSRTLEFGQMPFLRRFWNRLGVRAVSRLCHADITDSQSGFRVIRTELLRRISLTTKGFDTELELLIKACKKGFRVLSIPIHSQKLDGPFSSHFKPVKDTWLVCKLFLRSLFWKA
jgi:glycosyltransferase involved in cell wall biosynthesis